jgi:YD repeat-containing protein
VSLVVCCAHGNELTKTVHVSIIPSDSADQTPGEAQTGQTGVSSPTEPRPRLLTGWPTPVSRAALPARHVPQGTPLWQVSLGGSPTGEFGGRLVLSPVRLFDPNPTPPDTSILTLLGGASSGLDIVHPVCDGMADTNRFVAIRSKTCYVGFSSPTGFPFTASFYHPQALEDDFDERGHYRLKTSAEPFVVYTFAFAETDETAQSYAVTESRAGLPDRRIVLTCREAGGETVYGLKEGDGARRSEVSQLPVSNGVRTVVKRYSGTAGVGRTVREEYKTLGDFDRLVREVQTDGTETRERLYTYCEDAQSPFFGLPLSERTPSGERIAYVYDDAKRIVRETRTAIGLPQRERVLSYEPLNVRAHCPDGMGGIDIADDNGSEEFSTPRIETQYVNGIAVSKTLRFISTDTMAHRIKEEVRLLNPASGDISAEWENPANRRSYGDYKPKDGCRACSERPVLLKKPDGTIERYSYGSGDYTPGEDGSAGVFTPRSGGEAFRTVLTRYPAQPSVIQTNGAVTLALCFSHLQLTGRCSLQRIAAIQAECGGVRIAVATFSAKHRIVPP